MLPFVVSLRQIGDRSALQLVPIRRIKSQERSVHSMSNSDGASPRLRSGLFKAQS